MKKSVLEFDPDRMIAELEQFIVDRKKGDLSKYRITSIEAEPVNSKRAKEILAIREKKMRMSRGAFAKVLNVPVETLRAWEIGRRNPSGAALRLLQIAERAPDVLAFYARPEMIKNRRSAPTRKLRSSAKSK